MQTSKFPLQLQNAIYLMQSEERTKAIYAFHQCITSKTMDERHKIIALAWIVNLYSSRTSNRESFNMSSSGRISSTMTMDRRRSRSSAGVMRSSHSLENPTQTAQPPQPPPIVDPAIEKELKHKTMWFAPMQQWRLLR